MLSQSLFSSHDLKIITSKMGTTPEALEELMNEELELLMNDDESKFESSINMLLEFYQNMFLLD